MDILFGLFMGVFLGAALFPTPKEKIAKDVAYKIIVAGEFSIDGKKYTVTPADVVARKEGSK